MSNGKWTRRRFLGRGAAALSLLTLAGCGQIASVPWLRRVLESAEGLSRSVQRAITGGHPVAPEYSEADISQDFRANGTTNPQDNAYQAMVGNNFADWKLTVDGLVRTPLALSLAELRQMPSRTQITRHDCVEGWSSIGKWTGARLSAVLDRAGVQPNARYAMFFCADPMDDGSKYYESIDLAGAYQPQTILAYDFGGSPLPVAHGAPLRLRYETQLGYKMAKYVMRIELVDSFARFGQGKGGYWEDQGYEWWAGI